MNATEHIVEAYFQLVRHCFTIHDVKVPNGNNRQFDLLAFDPIASRYYHIEVAVTHEKSWNPWVGELVETVDYKFFGTPREPADRSNPNTDWFKGKSYLDAIEAAYATFGVDPHELTRVLCAWDLPKWGPADEPEPDEDPDHAVWRMSYASQYPESRFELLRFRDTVISELLKAVGGSNYEDEVLRTFSLLTKYEEQRR